MLLFKTTTNAAGCNIANSFSSNFRREAIGILNGLPSYLYFSPRKYVALLLNYHTTQFNKFTAIMR